MQIKVPKHLAFPKFSWQSFIDISFMDLPTPKSNQSFSLSLITRNLGMKDIKITRTSVSANRSYTSYIVFYHVCNMNHHPIVRLLMSTINPVKYVLDTIWSTFDCMPIAEQFICPSLQTGDQATVLSLIYSIQLCCHRSSRKTLNHREVWYHL